MSVFVVNMMLAVFCLFCLSGCVMLDGPRSGGDYAPEPMRAELDDEVNEPPADTTARRRPPAPARVGAELDDEMNEPPAAPGQMGECIEPSPSLPETDCTAWSYLHSLVIMSGVGGEPTVLTEKDIGRLEREIYPLFVQAQLNCGQWIEPHNDYEPITDVLAMLTFLGVETYDYDSSDLLESLLHGAAQEEFALSSEQIGCVKSLFVLFVSYQEVEDGN